MDAYAYEDQVVNVRVQVIDMNSFTLDLQVPNYLPARDLTQRIARDAGLDAFWDDGKRRLYWLRARGRLLQDAETLSDLGVINGELVYLLPEPPGGSGVVEQSPDFPESRGYAGKGTLTLAGSLLAIMFWAVAWGLALAVDRNLLTITLPGLAMGMLCTSFARHAWGGRGRALRVPTTALLVLFFLILVSFSIPIVMGVFSKLDLKDAPMLNLLLAAFPPVSPIALYQESVPGLLFGFVGVLTGWLAWWGGVEPLPKITEQAAVEQQTAEAVVPCGVCSGDVTADVRCECAYGCGRYFHVGCYKARTSVYRGDPRVCAICSARVA